MKKFLKVLGLILLAGFVLVASVGAYINFAPLPNYPTEKIAFDNVTVTPELVAHGAKIAAVQCNVCHTGADGKLSGKKLLEIPKDFGDIYSLNITQDKEKGIGNWSDADIAYLLRTGCRPDGSYTPIYMPKFPNMSDDDLRAIIAYLRSDMPQVQPSALEPEKSSPSFLTKFLCRVAFKKLDYPKQAIATPDSNNLQLYGKYLVVGRYDCWTCHSADFKTLNFNNPEQSPGYCGGGNLLLTMDGHPIYSANITPDSKTGLGDWTVEDFKSSLLQAKNKDGKTLRFPMIAYNGLTDNEVNAMWQYLRNLPAISKEVDRQWDKDL